MEPGNHVWKARVAFGTDVVRNLLGDDAEDLHRQLTDDQINQLACSSSTP
jgi:hypothetical protein